MCHCTFYSVYDILYVIHEFLCYTTTHLLSHYRLQIVPESTCTDAIRIPAYLDRGDATTASIVQGPKMNWDAVSSELKLSS